MVGLVLAFLASQTKLPPDDTLTKPNGHFAPVFAVTDGIIVRTAFPGDRADAMAGKVKVQFAGPERRVNSTIAIQLLRYLQRTNTNPNMVKLCTFHPDHIIHIPVGKESAQVVTCFTCQDVHLSFRGRSVLGSMSGAEALKNILASIVPEGDRRTAVLQERLGVAVADLLAGKTPATMESKGVVEMALDGPRRRWLTAILSTNPEYRPHRKGGPEVTIRFKDRTETIVIDFGKLTIGNPVPNPYVGTDWDQLRDCLLVD